MYRKYLKRPFDIVCALAAITVFSWLYIVVALLVRIKLGRPVIFKQPRPGKDEKIFTLYKFRTMTDERDEEGNLLPDDVRLTKFGKFLRSTSLDELPEAFNILLGHMSVVGPRPLLVQYLPLYNERQKQRHNVRPGLTGLAQVKGRNGITFEERFELDLEYIQNISFKSDVAIVFQTIKTVLKHEGISSKTSETMEYFIGTPKEKEGTKV